MGEKAERYMQAQVRADPSRGRARQRNDRPLSPGERQALRTLRMEARASGAVLANGGKGGLSPSLVLGVMRRDEYTCKVHGDKGEGNNGGLQVHHKGGIVESRWLSNKGHRNVRNNIVTLCSRAHDEIHTRAKREGVDSSQIQPSADKE